MKVLAYRLWNEPALAIAVVAAVVLAALEQFTGDGLTASDLPTIATFPIVGGAIRQFVVPDEKAEVAPPARDA
jgi:hypothetical protein